MGKSYTSKPKLAPYEFDLDGVHFVASGGVALLDLSELARLADVDVESPAGAAAVAQVFESFMGDAYAQFKAHCRRHQTDPDTLMAILQDVVEYVTRFPTERPLTRSPGPQPTPGTSPAGSPSAPSPTTTVDTDQLDPDALEEWLKIRSEAYQLPVQAPGATTSADTTPPPA